MVKGSIATHDHERVHFNLAKMSKAGKNFEVAIDADLAIKLKHGEQVDIREIVRSENIFFDVKKGELASDTDLQKVFNTSNALEIAKQIITDGQIQLTAEYRKQLMEDKKKRIVALIHRNAVDPRTHLPHPIGRIEDAITESKAKIDEFKSAEDQVNNILDSLKPILPIKFEVKELDIIIPAQYAGKNYSLLKSFGKLLKEEWLNDGSFHAIIEIPGGLEEELHEKLNNATHGTIKTEILTTK